MPPATPAAPAVAAPAPAVLHLPSRVDGLLLAVAMVAVSTSGPLMAATAAPALAIAFWRNALAVLAVVPHASAYSRADLRAAPARVLALALLAGGLLAAHFGTYVPSLHRTSVASAAALVCTQAVWAGVFARLLGERLPRQA